MPVPVAAGQRRLCSEPCVMMTTCRRCSWGVWESRHLDSGAVRSQAATLLRKRSHLFALDLCWPSNVSTAFSPFLRSRVAFLAAFF